MNTMKLYAITYRIPALVVLLLLSMQAVDAQYTAPPQMEVATDKTTYLQGEPVVLTMTLTNVSDSLEQYGPIEPWRAGLLLTISDDTGEEVGLHPVWNGNLVSTWFEDEKSATLPGETEQGSVILTHFYNLTQPGTYTLDLRYAHTTLEATGKRNVYVQRTVGLQTTSTTITIEAPSAPADTLVANLFTTALRAHLGLNISTSISDAYEEIIQQYPGSYLAEAAHFYLAYYKETSSGGVASALQETLQAYQTFLQLYPTSIFAEFAAEGFNNTRYLLNPPAPGQTSAIDIFMLAVCGDDLFRIANFNEQPVTVRYEVAGTAEMADVVLPPGVETMLQTQNTGGLVRLFLGADLIQARFANPSACGLLTQSPLPNLPGAVTIASTETDGDFSGNAFAINGVDHTLAGQSSGSGDDAYGIFTTTSIAQQNLLDALGGNQQDNVTGLGGSEPNIVQGNLDFDPAAFLDRLLTLVTDTLTTSPGGTLGSPDDPVVAYAPDGLVLSGNFDGTGVLIVDGPYSQRGSVDWTGLIIVRDDAATPPSFDLRGNGSVIGGVLLYNETASAASVSLQGSAEVRYSREAFEMLRTALFPAP